MPDRVIAAISHLPVSRTEKVVHRYSLVPPDSISSKYGYVTTLYLDFLRMNGQDSLVRNTLGFPQYLKYCYRLERVSQVFPIFMEMLVHKMKKVTKAKLMAS